MSPPSVPNYQKLPKAQVTQVTRRWN